MQADEMVNKKLSEYVTHCILTDSKT